MERKLRVVVVDDEEDIRETLLEYLNLHGIEAHAAGNAEELSRLLDGDEAGFDIAVLDINMPGEDGLSIARRLSDGTEMGIVMLTAAGEMVDRIVGLEMGADDYLAKPVNLRDLLARLKALGRRLQKGRTVQARVAEEARNRVPFGAMVLDVEAHKLFDAEGGEVPITAMEYDLLAAFAERPNRVLSRDQLLDLAHSRDSEPFDRSIDIRVARIRRKIEPDPAKPQVIKTVRGAGYIYVPPKPV